MTDELPDEIKELSADARGRVNLGTQFRNARVRVAVIEVVEEDEP